MQLFEDEHSMPSVSKHTSNLYIKVNVCTVCVCVFLACLNETACLYVTYLYCIHLNVGWRELKIED